MGSYRPLIGVTPWYDYEKSLTYIKRGYLEGVLKAGGLPLLLPAKAEDEVLSEFIERCDGFLLSGGPDVDAKYYGEENLPFNEEISPYRDHMEIFIAKKALECNKPIFGICRGIQILNVAMGGTLYQDINSQMKNTIKHSQEAPKWYPTHGICIEKGSRVWESFKSDRARVNSFHHQDVKDVAPGFFITSKASDGVIESIEHGNHRFAVGVQWHPELMWQEDITYLRLFEDFIKAAGKF